MQFFKAAFFVSLAATGAFAGVLFGQSMPAMPGMNMPATTASAPGASQPAAAQAGIDLHNTICPVSGDQVGDCKLTELYDGKIYHFCCQDCPVEFKKTPAKYAQAVAADPAKYGIVPSTKP